MCRAIDYESLITAVHYASGSSNLQCKERFYNIVSRPPSGGPLLSHSSACYSLLSRGDGSTIRLWQGPPWPPAFFFFVGNDDHFNLFFNLEYFSKASSETNHIVSVQE